MKARVAYKTRGGFWDEAYRVGDVLWDNVVVCEELSSEAAEDLSSEMNTAWLHGRAGEEHESDNVHVVWAREMGRAEIPEVAE